MGWGKGEDYLIFPGGERGEREVRRGKQRKGRRGKGRRGKGEEREGEEREGEEREGGGKQILLFVIYLQTAVE